MIGHFDKNLEILNSLRWCDAEIEKTELNYEKIIITLTANHRLRTVRLWGYISFEIEGFWDEVIIESVKLFKKHELLDRTLRSINRRKKFASGCPTRNNEDWLLIEILLIDGVVIRSVFSELEVTNQ